MDITLVFGIIATLILVSMVLSGISYNRQQAMKKRRAQINRFKHQADELYGVISLLLKIDEKYELICELQNIVVNSLHGAHSLAPEDPLLASSYQTQAARFQQLKTSTRENKASCYTTNDAELNQAMSQLSHLSKVLDIYKNRGTIAVAKHQDLCNHLQTLRVDLDINSNLFQADNFAANGDITMYQMHLKQALEVLKRSTIESTEKHERIKYLSDMLTEVKKTNVVIADQKLLQSTKPKINTESKFKY